MTAPLLTFSIRNLTAHHDHDFPYHTATLVQGSQETHVSSRYGSWQARDGDKWREVLPDVAADLQDELKRLARKRKP